MTLVAEPAARAAHQLPPWRSVLAVVAHPDDESFGLGGLIRAFATANARVDVMTFTRGEASTLHAVPGDLQRLRAAELANAARILGISGTTLLGHRDGALAETPLGTLVKEISGASRGRRIDGLLAFDANGVTGHPDHIAATAAAVAFAEQAQLPLLGWTLPSGVADRLNLELGGAMAGRPPDQVDLCVRVDRATQHRACLAHASQATSSLLWRRLQLLGDCEHLRWLYTPTAADAADAADAAGH